MSIVTITVDNHGLSISEIQRAIREAAQEKRIEKVRGKQRAERLNEEYANIPWYKLRTGVSK
jgi:hypothetical protein